MVFESYQEQINFQRTQKIREYLRELPAACSDFINSIVMTTSTLTRLAYVIDLHTFCSYVFREVAFFADKSVGTWTDADWEAISVRDLNAYVDYLTFYYKESENQNSDAPIVLRNHECGVMRKLSSLRSFFGYMFKSERIKRNTLDLVSLPKIHEKPILYLSDDEMENLLSVAESGDKLSDGQKKYHKLTQKRDYAMLMLFLGTGIRVSECVSINVEDIDLENNAVLVTRKGGNQMILYYPDEVSEALRAYMEQRMEVDTVSDDEHALFLSMQKRRITQRAVQIMVKKYCQIAAPLKKHLSPHKLRSTYATRLYRETEDIYLVADALGHSDVNTTRRHYAAMSNEHRREAAKSVHLTEKKNETNE